MYALKHSYFPNADILMMINERKSWLKIVSFRTCAERKPANYVKNDSFNSSQPARTVFTSFDKNSLN